MKFLLLLVALTASVSVFAADDTNRARCSREMLEKGSFASGELAKLARTGKVQVKAWSTRSDQYNFGPTIYKYMWYTTKNGKLLAQYCQRCYQNRIFEDDAWVDGGAFEYVGGDVKACTVDSNY